VEPIRKLDRSVKGRAAFVTGAASGMGRATAHLFAQEGAMVAVTDINQAGIDTVVAEIQANGGSAEGWHLDVFDAAEIKRVVAEAAGRFGRLDILINNAGFGAFRPIDDDRFDAAWERALSGLLTAQQLLIRAARRFCANPTPPESSISRRPKVWAQRRGTRRMWWPKPA